MTTTKFLHLLKWFFFPWRTEKPLAPVSIAWGHCCHGYWMRITYRTRLEVRVETIPLTERFGVEKVSMN